MATENTIKPARGRYVIYYKMDYLYHAYRATWGHITAVLRSGKILVSGIGEIQPGAILEVLKYDTFESLESAAKKYPNITKQDYDKLIENGNS